MCTFTHVTQLQCNSNRWSGPDSKYILRASAKSSGLCGEILSAFRTAPFVLLS